jgi:hypothetical protein
VMVARSEWCTRPGAGCRSISAMRNAIEINFSVIP